jgi:ribosomal protein S18 acetylase RimI-like enzyme
MEGNIVNITSDYIIRNYCDTDAEKIGSFDKITELAYRYNADFKPTNILCSVNSEGEILAVGHLEPHITWAPIDKDSQSPDYTYDLRVSIILNPEYECTMNVSSDLMDALLNRAGEIKKDYPGKKIRVIKYISSDNNEEMDFLISKGFAVTRTSLVMKRDLVEEIPSYPCSSDIRIVDWKLETEEDLKRYFDADSTCSDGAAWSINMVRWMRNAPEWATFAAFSGDELVGSVMTWLITEERSATENIFVLPQWRRKGVAKAFITEALKHLKKQGKTMATLSVFGDNKPALQLYKSLGYKMYFLNLEFGYDV